MCVHLSVDVRRSMTEPSWKVTVTEEGLEGALGEGRKRMKTYNTTSRRYLQRCFTA